MVELGKHVLHVTMPAANEVFVPGTSAELGVDVGSLHIFDATP